MEREAGIEPATNSLEGCDSTTELLPLKTSAAKAANLTAYVGTAEADALPKTPVPSQKNAQDFDCGLPTSTSLGLTPANRLNMEPMTRIELVTSPLPRECSTN
jgi:hypothetical protein